MEHEPISADLARVSSGSGEQARRVAVEKLQGWAQWAALEPLSPQDRTLWVLQHRADLTRGLHQRLVEASRPYSRSTPRQGVDILRLAVAVAEHIEPARLSSEAARFDLLAESYALLGNALRLASDFDAARTAFAAAWQQEARGTDNLYTKAHILRLEAHWKIDMGELEAAEATLQEALGYYRLVGDAHLEGLVLVKMGIAAGAIDAARGLRHLRQALDRLDPQQEPRLWLCAQHDLAWFLAEDGNNDGALAVLEDIRPLYRQFPDDHTQLRLHWLEAKIARNLGRVDEAIPILQLLREQFRAKELRHELLLVTLDLAEALAAGRVEQAEHLVRQFFPILTAWRLHRHALAAWLRLREALENRELDDLIPRLRLYYRRHWHRPAAFATE